MTDWRDLEAELDSWATENRTATLWWRDDDAVAVTPALKQLIAIGTAHGVPLALAVIPARAKPSLAVYLAGRANVNVLQHGHGHTNHAPANQKKAELGPHRPTAAIIADVKRGAARLKELIPNALAVLVPPWNRISEDAARQLPGIGITGLSTFRSRSEQAPIAGLRIANTHADIIDWRGTRGFAGCSAVLDQMLDHLKSRRMTRVDADEPTGLLTHHLVHTDDCWPFLDDLFSLTQRHPAARWLSASELFSDRPTG